MYFIRHSNRTHPEKQDDDSPIPENDITKDGYLKFKYYKWTFYGISNTKSRFTDNKDTRTALLQNPVASSPIVAATKHLLSEELKTVNAFDDTVMVEKLVRI